MQFAPIFKQQLMPLYLAHDPDNEIAGSYERIEDMHPFVGQGVTELVLKNAPQPSAP